MELSNTKWLLGFYNGIKLRRKSIDARDRDRKRFLSELALAKEKLGLPPNAEILSCYEAGRDGFWIHHWLESEGIRNHILDSVSIEVSRHKRRAKTDRLDVESLIGVFSRWLAGERKACSVVNVPTPQEEDAQPAGFALT